MPEVFEPGSGAPSSGVYKVIHARQHAQPHYVTALYVTHSLRAKSVRSKSDLSWQCQPYMSTHTRSLRADKTSKN